MNVTGLGIDWQKCSKSKPVLERSDGITFILGGNSQGAARSIGNGQTTGHQPRAWVPRRREPRGQRAASAPRDPEALAQAIERLLVDREMRERFGRAAREKAEREFDEQKVVAEILANYDSLLGTATNSIAVSRPHENRRGEPT